MIWIHFSALLTSCSLFYTLKSVEILDCKLWDGVYVFDALCGNEFIFPLSFFLLCENLTEWRLQKCSFCLGFSFKLEKLVDLPCLPMIMARCQFSWQLANHFYKLAKECLGLKASANKCQQTPRKFLLAVGHVCWQKWLPRPCHFCQDICQQLIGRECAHGR